MRIPEDYRDFLLKVANGGIEPCRLLSLSLWGDSYWTDETPAQLLAAPCVVTPDCGQHGENWLPQLHIDDWQDRWDANQWSPMQGTMAIAEIGCGLFYSMVVNGPFRGRVFHWGDEADKPPVFSPEDSFSDWIGACLDLTLSGRAVHFLDGKLR